ncbi:hypothetical protein AB0D08_34115, partial [Kitasatospora sp. NPDC048540]
MTTSRSGRPGCLVLVAGLLFTAAFAPWISPYDPLKQNLMNTL